MPLSLFSYSSPDLCAADPLSLLFPLNGNQNHCSSKVGVSSLRAGGRELQWNMSSRIHTLNIKSPVGWRLEKRPWGRSDRQERSFCALPREGTRQQVRKPHLTWDLQIPWSWISRHQDWEGCFCCLSHSVYGVVLSVQTRAVLMRLHINMYYSFIANL